VKPDVVQLTKDLVAIDSVSQRSNAEVSDLLEETLQRYAFEVERLEYVDEQGERKVNLVAKKGEGSDGFGLFSHSDTVPGNGWDRDPLDPGVEGGCIIGLGCCDMKGPLAATIVAGADVDASTLKRPLFIVVTSDEETSCLGARHVVEASVLFRTNRPRHGVIAEPTHLTPVYAHKGGGRITVTAHGRAAHTSMDRGISANFLIAPFLAEMAELEKLFKADTSFMNHDFTPPTIGFNMVIDDGGCKPNVTAAKTVCTISFRTMPNDRRDDVIAIVTAKAERYGLHVSSSITTPFSISPETEIVQAGLRATGVTQPGTIPFGTDAMVFKDHLQLVILGPGDIAQAHTAGEWVEVAQLERAVGVYRRMIEMLCV
jgi:acetylornithine deacetylase